ncbi:Uma2 family endonuclease [Streptomyces albofaciens JCM 4342]|uniref:Uma2 family endonuclease n=1 Tax=Streptomyces albofaciens TaxID=66866 RepID=UPI001239D139|nr:Uma2 family endonuclease [Streptomyces albofaciens]KAA6220861.1 Uma2 family endonuclease [Streptomyces albofaciens JCM 4342]
MAKTGVASAAEGEGVRCNAPSVPEEPDVGVLKAHASVLSQEQFEELAHLGLRVEEALRLELINGRIREKPIPDGDHAEIIAWLTRLCTQIDAGWWLHVGQGLRVEKYRKGNARPDGCLASSDAFVGQGEWADAEGVLMAVEVTSRDYDTNRRDREEKPKAYAEAGIPVYLIVDPNDATWHVLQLDGRHYVETAKGIFGQEIPMPEPMGFTVRTAGWHPYGGTGGTSA